MKQDFIYTIENGEIKKVYAEYKQLLQLAKLPGYYFSFSEVAKVKRSNKVINN